MIDRRRLLAAGAALGLGRAGVQAAPDLATEARRLGVVVMLRHATTDPGIGDPPGYRLDDCRSQRNLSAEGRAQAQALGGRLAAQGLRPTRVLSSRWCRCLDTARLAFGRAEPWSALDSFFDAPEREAAQTAVLREALAALAPGEVVAWVSHMVNIAALTGEGAAMGAALVLRGERQADGSLGILRLGRIEGLARG